MKRATVLFAFLLALTGLIAAQASAAGTAPAATERLQGLEQTLLAQLNATRASHGLRALTLSDELSNAAASHSRSMLVDGYFEHESKDGSPFFARVKRFYRATGYERWSVGENLLYSTAEMDAATAIEAWLDSPAHRRIMLTPGWRDVGVSALHASAAGGSFDGEPTWVITMDFGVRTAAKAQQRALQAVTRTKPRKPKKPAAKTSSQTVRRVLPLPVAAPTDS